jgi:outer membrane protein
MQILFKEIQQAQADAKAALQNYESRNEAVIASEENYKYNQQKFDVGIINSVDYNIAKNNYTKAQSDLLQAKYQYIFKMKILDFYRGKKITL